jgi:NAD(P)-dependent dehydrogenase (short-subunit alcohol dehydrogenase family)
MSAFALQAGPRVLMTAGAAGIGRVIAETFLSAGARVLVCDCDGDALAQELARQGGLSGHRYDISDPKEVAVLFAQVSRTLGGLDVLANNAGVSGPTAAVESSMSRTARRNIPNTSWSGLRVRRRSRCARLKRSFASPGVQVQSKSAQRAEYTGEFSSGPNGIRTRVSALRGPCPGPLDDGAGQTQRTQR